MTLMHESIKNCLPSNTEQCKMCVIALMHENEHINCPGLSYQSQLKLSVPYIAVCLGV